MLEGKETDPEHLLPKGKMGLGQMLGILIGCNSVIFGAVLGIAWLLLNQHIDGALRIAEIVTAATVVISAVALVVKRK